MRGQSFFELSPRVGGALFLAHRCLPHAAPRFQTKPPKTRNMKTPLHTLPWLALATALSLPWLASDSQAQQLPSPRSTKQQVQLPPCSPTQFTCPDNCSTVSYEVRSPSTLTVPFYNPTPQRVGSLPAIPGIPKFNPAFGTLKGVEISFSANTVDRRYQFTNNGGTCAPAPSLLTGACPVRVGADMSITIPAIGLAFTPPLENAPYVRNTHWPWSNPAASGNLFEQPGLSGITQFVAGPVEDPNNNAFCAPVNQATVFAPPAGGCSAPMDGGKGLAFLNGSNQVYGWRNCWDDNAPFVQTECVTNSAQLAAFIGSGTCAGSAPCCFTLGGDPVCPNETVPVSKIENSLNQVNDANLTAGGGCSQYTHTLFNKLAATVSVKYIYCPANLPPQTQPDIATVCRNLTGACLSSVDIPVLANDCDPVTCTGSTTSGRLNCGSIVITQAPANGSVTIVGCSGTSTQQGCPQTNNCSGCVVRYTPTNGYTGPDSFCYTVADNEGKVSCATPVSIRVLPAPNANDDAFDTCVNSPITIKPLANDTGAPAAAAFTPSPCTQTNPGSGCVPQPLTLPAVAVTQINCTTLSIVTPPTNGTLSINQACTGVVGPCTACAGNNCVVYTPNSGFCGTDTFVYKVNDSSGCCDTATVTIRVFPRPVANDDCIELCEEASCEADNCVVIPILANDTQGTCGSLPTSPINCGSVTITSTLTPPSAGTLTIGQNCGGQANGGCTTACVRFCPAPGFRGQASFKYRISDSRTVNGSVCQSNPFPCPSNEATVTLFVRCAPDAVDDVYCDPNPLDLSVLVIPVLSNDTFVSSGINADTCTNAGVGFATPPIEIVAGGTTGCQGPTKGTAEVFLDSDNVWKIRYTPTVALGPTGQDFIQYRLKNVYPNLTNCLPAGALGCCDTACVTIKFCPCPERPRNDCASLLLYPEVVMGGGSKTFLTITDACCEGNTQNTRVEFVFVNGASCERIHKTVILTPCDQLSIDASSLFGVTSGSGYVYAFAKSATTNAANPGGIPIVWNHLIGETLRVDGPSGLSYALNPVAFRAYGTAEGAFNDDDNDGIRDFNATDETGVPSPPANWEYDPIPDAILIPRFVGQGAEGTASGLVLLGLSGGQKFSTKVRIQRWNDSEDLVANDYTFSCWTKQPLSSVAPSTTQSMLVMPTDDAQEIVGWPQPPAGAPRLSAGWLRIDGVSATSTVTPFEVIQNPAIYAVLIEVRDGRVVADLPYEECSQVNGSLLPVDPLGDGDPTPANNDNQ
jgi:hypothetical protein